MSTAPTFHSLLQSSPQYRLVADAVKRYNKRTGLVLSTIKAALIDMDGTLYDSMPWHALAWHKMMSELGVHTEVDEFFSYEGMTGKATINLLMNRTFGRKVNDEEAARLYAIKSKYFRENNRAKIMPGALEMVATLKKAGVDTILVTGSGQDSLLDKINEDFNGAFPTEKRITARNVINSKPHPEPYIKALGLADVKPFEAIVIENAPLGVKSGVEAQVFTIGIKTGPIPIEKFYEAGADLVFDSMPDFATFLPYLLNFNKVQSF